MRIMAANYPLVSIILLNYYGITDTMECIDSLLNQSYDNYEIIVLDNGTRDKDYDRLERIYGDRIELMKSSRNLGYSKGNNKASDYAKGKYIWFLNNDTIVEKDALEELIRAIKKHDNVGIVMPLEYSYYDRTDLRSNQLFYNRFGLRSKRSIFSRMNYIKDEYSNEGCIEVSYASGSALLIEKKLFFRLGKFDNEMFAYNEDVDLSFRCWTRGFRIVLVPSSKIYHKIGSSSQENSGWRIYETSKNALRSRIKNLQWGTLFLFIQVFLGHIVIRSLVDIISDGDFIKAKARVKSITWNIINLEDTLEERREIQENRVSKDSRFLLG